MCKDQARPTISFPGRDVEQVVGHHLGAMAEQRADAVQGRPGHRRVIAEQTLRGAGLCDGVVVGVRVGGGERGRRPAQRAGQVVGDDPQGAGAVGLADGHGGIDHGRRVRPAAVVAEQGAEVVGRHRTRLRGKEIVDGGEESPGARRRGHLQGSVEAVEPDAVRRWAPGVAGTEPVDEIPVAGHVAEAVAEPGREHLIEFCDAAGHVVVDRGRGEEVRLQGDRPVAPVDQMTQEVVAQQGECRDAVCRLAERNQHRRLGPRDQDVVEGSADVGRFVERSARQHGAHEPSQGRSNSTVSLKNQMRLCAPRCAPYPAITLNRRC